MLPSTQPLRSLPLGRKGHHDCATFLAVLVAVGLVTHFLGIEAGLVALVLGVVGPVVAPQIYQSMPPHPTRHEDSDNDMQQIEAKNESDEPLDTDGSIP